MTQESISWPGFLMRSAVTGAGLALTGLAQLAFAQAREAPPGLFRDLNDEIVGEAILLHGKQLFIDDYVIETLQGAEKVLHQPVKHPRNPLLVRDKPWEGFALTYGTVMYEPEEGIYKMWYQVWQGDEKNAVGAMGYATSPDGIVWEKPIINEPEQSNLVFAPKGLAGPGLFKDPVETDPQRRYKMLYSANPDGTAKSWSTNAAYSPDGIHWTPEPQNPLIPFSDTQNCPYWDAQRQRYVAYLRFGPPNTRLISRIESEDFVHWSPKVTVLGLSKIDEPFNTCLYGMEILPYEGIYVGLLTPYHGETIQPIPADQLWRDKVNVQLAFSRNGVTWTRVGRQGAIPSGEHPDWDWRQVAEQAVFIPYGEHGKDWDWGQIYPFQPPLVVGDEIRIYYTGINGRHWWNYHGDTVQTAVGLATLRLDGFVSVNAGTEEGTLTTKPLVFLGDTLVVNADAAGGSLRVEALDPQGNVIEGFSKEDCTPITTDSVRHVLQWRDNPDCHLLQARPIKLRFYLRQAQLYSFEPRIRHTHYVQSYD